ncbi:threonine synthase [Treponema primitia ZAS-2]|uniref:Threonine synthase n=1 Tax=Treponema primitia (strain ATCC BAA-887 / DSM 12427 / ZAS-2) TaxID=545694 RepID=F5YLJ0_TREPZ|nr:threonine synthase [Treponema primitia]AEF84480.1 threonine synthase [Treponema primitia ZAS-2]
MKSSITGLICPKCHAHYDHRELQGLCRCGSPLLVEYDLISVGKKVNPDKLRHRPATLWRYGELLPVLDESNIVSLGEGFTPLTLLPKITAKYDFGNLLMKDEGVIPTGTFKARGAAVGVSKAKELGVTHVAMPTNGNAGAAWAVYAARAGISAHILMPEDAPRITRNESIAAGAEVYLVQGLISDCGKILARSIPAHGWYDVSTLKEPYRIEGKKTMGYEIVEQLGWQVPDVIAYPTGGGVGIIGIYKALKEMQGLGWIGEKLPRLVAVQASGCAPIVEAYRKKAKESEFFPNSKTIAFGINVPKALGDFLVLEALYETGGCAVAVEDREILESLAELASTEGAFVCPEGAAVLAALKRLRAENWLKADETAVLLNTGAGIKYPDTLQFKLNYCPVDGTI